jgi:hypothetical protein
MVTVIKNDAFLANVVTLSSTVTEITSDTVSTGCQAYAKGDVDIGFYQAN